MNKISVSAAATVIILFGILVVSSVYAANVGLTIQPIKISHTIEAGDFVSDVITLTNASDVRVKVGIKVEDFIPVAGQEGIQFVGRAPGITTARDWIKIEDEKKFIFEKGESRSIRYIVSPPANAEPGSHFGVLLFKANELEQKGQLQIGTQVGALLFITVPGDFLQKGRILDFTGPAFVQKGPVNFKIKFENTGTVHFEPKGMIEIKNMFGKTVGQAPVSGTAVLPTGVKEVAASWDIEGFLWGRYAASVKLFDGEGNELTADKISFYGFPLWYAAGFILAVIILFFGIKFLKNKVRFSISLKDNN